MVARHVEAMCMDGRCAGLMWCESRYAPSGYSRCVYHVGYIYIDKKRTRVRMYASWASTRQVCMRYEHTEDVFFSVRLVRRTQEMGENSFFGVHCTRLFVQTFKGYSCIFQVSHMLFMAIKPYQTRQNVFVSRADATHRRQPERTLVLRTLTV